MLLLNKIICLDYLKSGLEEFAAFNFVVCLKQMQSLLFALLKIMHSVLNPFLNGKEYLCGDRFLQKHQSEVMERFYVRIFMLLTTSLHFGSVSAFSDNGCIFIVQIFSLKQTQCAVLLTCTIYSISCPLRLECTAFNTVQR